ncbi:MAG: DUF6249 domain-containing protein [Flavobacteriaceae bacterium]
MVGVVFISLFVVVFGIFYLFFSTRNKERLALIEKGAEASIFIKGHSGGTYSFWKVLLLNLSVLLMSIGLAVFIASFMVHSLNMYEEVAYPGTIFLMAGIGLFVGFTLTKKLSQAN